ncbi:unnamed protein product [Leuciscus chuanchicus]
MIAASEEISKAVLAALPGLPPDTLTSLMTGLESLGVQSREDLYYLKEDDLLIYLRPIQCRRLICAFTPKDSSSVLSPPGSPDPYSALSPPGSPQTSSNLCYPGEGPSSNLDTARIRQAAGKPRDKHRH